MLAIGLLIAPISAHAFAIIDFGTGALEDGGILTYLGGNNSSGVNIPIGSMRVSGTPYFNGESIVTDGVLNYNTSLNTVTIYGSVFGLPDANLLTGSFSSFTTIFTAGRSLMLINASGPDTKSPALLTELGLSTDTKFELYGFSLSGQPYEGSRTTFKATSTDFRNTSVVPEPISLLLFGLGLIGVAGIRRKIK